ncbi:MAG: hypothetical protein ACOYD0_01765 [Candidatus Nanopelagicales bacterium]
MTAVTHEGLRRASRRPRAGARVVRPGGATSRSGASTVGRPVLSTSGASAAAGVAAPSWSGGVLAGNKVRLVLAGRRLRMGSGAFVLFVLGSLTMMLIVLLFLNTSLAEDSFRLLDVRQASKELTVREETLSEQLAAAESPVGLEQRARDLGMVPAGSPLFLRLSDGKILGQSTPALAPPAPKAKKAKSKPADSAAAGSTGVTAAGGESPVDGQTGFSGGIGGETPVSGSTQWTDNGEIIDPRTGQPMLPAPTTAPGGEQSVGLIPSGAR